MYRFSPRPSQLLSIRTASCNPTRLSKPPCRRFSLPRGLEGLTVEPPRGDFQRRHSIVFLQAGWNTPQLWKPSCDHFAGIGYECATLQLREDASLDEQAVDALTATTSLSNKECVVVGLGIGAFVVQKSLELGTCSGAILVNPVPPSPGDFLRGVCDVPPEADLRTKLSDYTYKGFLQSLLDKPQLPVAPEKLLNLHPNDPRWDDSVMELGAPRLQLVEDMLDSPVAQTNTKTVKLVVASTEDQLVSRECIEDTARFHDAEVKWVNKGSHLFVYHQEKQREEFHAIVEEWMKERLNESQ